MGHETHPLPTAFFYIVVLVVVLGISGGNWGKKNKKRDSGVVVKIGKFGSCNCGGD